ncbi:polyprenyl synthetase family protein [Longimicrobium terrae]|uniref:Octaprenyl-diphosphate synthase n=1 Tax=Longimicrobium terrae TaxID=1639882 RepID=A0A841GUK7_9BACT|nr:polyprenyl synthetase family protein [Longimicrobium terrae]MBB4634316.1 octaprenyl-diphosphate synthase [Longimicrobium terrae]MBB6068794.1 octaprenyl-diphosphate synthase [Longimicrobium terrae]NNC27979.1 polyprenyl synthetase family protein [Longimicrobium terrae]
MSARTAVPHLADIQGPIQGRLDAVVDEIRRIVVSDFAPVETVNEYLMKIRGKLFRPGLMLLCDELNGAPTPHAETLAAIIELVHLATLVHDDAVDHSVLRRGMPTVNALWSHQVAIIMGDYLYSRSISEITRLGNIEYIQVIAEAATAMTVGEMRQLSSHDALDFSEADYNRLIEAKTASLMAAACELGALTGAPEHRDRLRTFGHELGMAFQVADDLLDYTADSAVTGKPTGLDLREHKVTLPLIHALPLFSAQERARVDALFADPEPSDESIAEVVRAVRDRGGLDFAHGRALEYAQRAERALEGLPEGPALEALRAGIVYAIERRR